MISCIRSEGWLVNACSFTVALRLLAITAALWLATTHGRVTATVSKLPLGNGVDQIFITGRIDERTPEAFRTQVLSSKSVAVVLDSPGGLLVPAIEIGRIIRMMGHSTAVLKGECSSACAVIWAIRYGPNDDRPQDYVRYKFLAKELLDCMGAVNFLNMDSLLYIFR
jgi:hypothetical protein